MPHHSGAELPGAQALRQMAAQSDSRALFSDRRPDPAYADLFLNRELSWLQFNRRVLAEAADETLPGYERLKFLSIYCSNLDEFYMVRVGGLLDRALLQPWHTETVTGLTPREQLRAIYAETARQQKDFESLWRKVTAALAKQHVEILDSQKERVELGAGSSADVTQTKGRLARAQSTLTDAEASLREGEASYIRLTGKPVPASLAEVYVPEPMYTGYDAVMEVADKNNPKLKAYMSDIKAARGEKELAESAYHPKINFEVGPSYSDRSGPGSQWTSGVDAGLVMRWNLFNSGADKPGTEAAESRTRMATETLYNFHDELALEIENTWTRYLAAKEQKKYYEEAIGYNTATRDAYLEQFKLGERSLLDVLDAESELFNSSTQYTTANGNVVVGAYRLYALTGMLLPELGIKEDPLYESPRNQQEKR